MKPTDRNWATAEYLLTAGAACAALTTLLIGRTWAALMAAGLLITLLMRYRSTAKGEPYAYWVAWGVGTVIALLLARTGPTELLPLAAAEFVVAVVLFFLWRTHRGGRRDWLVWSPESGLLRRESFKKDAIAWAEEHGQPCMISRVDHVPELANKIPMYPMRDYPMERVPPWAS
ncbi:MULTISPECIES: hypothetical protein [Bacteria]|uniref:Uncharacterized protein n=1 Tax=Streptomyces sindenensis TaxID=67363 RepID=A0ABW6EYL9_9ACTN